MRSSECGRKGTGDPRRIATQWVAHAEGLTVAGPLPVRLRRTSLSQSWERDHHLILVADGALLGLRRSCLRSTRRHGLAPMVPGAVRPGLVLIQVLLLIYRLSLMASGLPDPSDLWMASRMAVLLSPSRALTMVSSPVLHAWTKERMEEGIAPTHWSKTL